jgi:Txe/YoeB family toxin of Txe-Axe toxin-antitoxin module
MIKMNALKETVEKLRETGYIGLEDFRNLQMKDVEVLTEEIKQWCLYGNGKPEKLGKKHKEN